MLFVIIYSICFAGGSCLINVICYYSLHLFCSSCLINVICYYLLRLFCRRFMSYQCYLLLFTPFVLQFMSYQCYLLLFTPFVLQEVHVLSMLFVIIYSICFAGGSCLINVICYYLLHLFCRRFMSYQCYLLLFTPFVLQVMSYQCYLLLFTPIVLQEVHLLSMLFVISYSICFAGGSCLINVICYYLLRLFCRRFMSYPCYLLLFTPIVLQVMSYQCYLLLFTPFVLQEVHVLSMLFVIIYSICFAGGSFLINVICYYLLHCFAGGSFLINVICYYLLHLFCRRFMSYQCYLLLFTPFVLQEVHVLSMLFVIIYSNCFAGHVLSMLFVIIYSICFAGGSCLINVICYYLLHLFCRRFMSYQCYLLLFTPIVLQVMSYQCYLLLFTPFVLQEVHVLSMLFVIIYSICFAGGSCLINVICYYLLQLFCRRFISYQCYLLLVTPFVLQEVHVLSMLFVIIYSNCFAGHVLSMLFVIIYSICFAGGSCLINVICYYFLQLFCRRFMSYQCYLLLFMYCGVQYDFYFISYSRNVCH